MPPPLSVFARRADDRIVFGDAPAPLSMTLHGLRSADGHGVAAYARAAVRGVDRAADTRLFAEQFLAGRDAVSLDDIARHFAAAIAPAAGDFVAARSAGDVLARRAELERVLQDRCDAAAFGCGLERTSLLSLTLDCPTLRDVQDRQAARERQAAAAAHAATIAQSFTNAAGTAAGDDVRLEDRLAAMPQTRVALTAGPNVIWLDGDGGMTGVEAPPEVGALRSVRSLGGGRLAVGGVTGVAVLGGDGSPEAIFAGGNTSGRGFNAVAYYGPPTPGMWPASARIAATHGDLGLTLWDGQAAPRVLATPGPARHLVACGDALALAAGNAVFGLADGALRPVDEGPAGIVGLLVVDARFVVVRQDGSVRGIDPDSFQTTDLGSIANAPVVAAVGLQTQGLAALVTADDRGNVDAVTPDGRPLGRLASRVGGVRMIATAGGRLFVVTGDRASVLCLDPTGIERPRTINVVARVGHHVTDLVAE